MGVSKNNGKCPKSSIKKLGFPWNKPSIWVFSLFLETSIYTSSAPYHTIAAPQLDLWFHRHIFALAIRDLHQHHPESTRCIGDGMGYLPPLIGNPYNGYINPYYWVDAHPLFYGNNGSLDPIAHMTFSREAISTNFYQTIDLAMITPGNSPSL